MKEKKLRREEIQGRNQKQKGEWWDGAKHTKIRRTDTETVGLAVTESEESSKPIVYSNEVRRIQQNALFQVVCETFFLVRELNHECRPWHKTAQIINKTIILSKFHVNCMIFSLNNYVQLLNLEKNPEIQNFPVYLSSPSNHFFYNINKDKTSSDVSCVSHILLFTAYE